MQNCLRSTKEASPIPLTKQYRYTTRRVRYIPPRYIFATDMPNSLSLLIHSFNFSFNHTPQALSVIYAPNCVIAVFFPTCCEVAFYKLT